MSAPGCRDVTLVLIVSVTDVAHCCYDNKSWVEKKNPEHKVCFFFFFGQLCCIEGSAEEESKKCCW